MAGTVMHRLDIPAPRYWGLLGALAVLIALGFAAFVHMETSGHVVTGMDNQIVWGVPHVFAVFLIVAASGALNVASTASVFGRSHYKPLAPLSALLAVALLAGGLTVLVADLGRPDRLIVAMTHFNFRSIFAWNVFLYTGFFAVVGTYLWWLLDPRMHHLSARAGLAAFLWRLTLTTGTGSIFGFLVAREPYDSALLAPMFVVFSFAYGTALFLLMLLAIYDRNALGAELLARLKGLLAIFVAVSLALLAVFHLTKIYVARYAGAESFVLADGGIYTALFWAGQVGAGGIAPLLILYSRPLSASRRWIALAALLVTAGGLAQMYVTIIGAQAYPLALFPGQETSSRFFDGEIHPYAPSAPEILLGLGGVALALAIVLVALRVLGMLPRRPDDDGIGASDTPGSTGA